MADQDIDDADEARKGGSAEDSNPSGEDDGMEDLDESDESDEADEQDMDISGPPRSHRIALLIAVAVIVLGLDLWSKQWAWDNLRDAPAVTVIDDWLYFEFGFNTGSAFSFLRDAAWARVTFIGVTLLALLYMARLASTLPTRWSSAFVAVALVTGGALGNLHDRLFRVMELRGAARHGVVDFVKVYYWPGKVWPTFNIADVALVVGVGLLLIFLTRHGDALDRDKAKSRAAVGDPKAA